MPLITKHFQGMVIAQLTGFPVCVGFITFGSVSSKWKSKATTKPCDLVPVWVKSYICYVLGCKWHFQNCKNKFTVASVLHCVYLGLFPKSFAKRTWVFKLWKEPLCLLSLSASASRFVSILSCLGCTSTAIFHSFTAVSQMKVLQCHNSS